MRPPREEQPAPGKARIPQHRPAAPVSGDTAVQRAPALQSGIGNAAVVEMLRRAGHPGTQEHHGPGPGSDHGPGCGHCSPRPPVQRAPARDEEDEPAHRPAEPTPGEQSTLLAAAMDSPSRPLPSSVVAKATAFYRNDALSSTRVHHDAVAQRATAALGAEAMTVGNHIFLSAGATAEERLIGHELSHVDKNLRNLPETGHRNGAGVTVTDPRQASERAAERDGDAYAAGKPTAPSLLTPHTAAPGAHQPVQRMMEEGAGDGRRVALEEQPPGLSSEEHVAGLGEDSEEEVLLKRGVTPTQRMHMQREIIRGSFVSFPKIMRAPDENAARPDDEHVRGYVSQHRDDEIAKLIEFSTDPEIATKFASEARWGYVLTIRIKRKYLAKGATGGERGWIAQQGAPYDIVAVERRDSLEPGLVPLTEAELRDAVRNEEMAEFLLSVQDPVAMAAHLNRFTGMEKVNEAKKIAEYKKTVFA
ncbi:uncharacterized protein DUF4157 [Streptomyces sp. PsTaAH-130]|nr:uncharacterized protein DUF4157 [Streptomyces sp. PsTaAH-130]